MRRAGEYRPRAPADQRRGRRSASDRAAGQSGADHRSHIVNRTLDTTGKLVNEQTVGRLLDLPVINQTTNTAGQAVKQVRDAAGNIIEYTLDNAGNIVNARVLNSGGRQ